MIERYTRPKMGKLWAPESRFHHMLSVEVAVAKAEAKLKIIPVAASRAISSKAKFSMKRINELEATTRHDVIAFVSNLAENVGPHGKYVHYGLTSSDVLDTALSLQIGSAGELLNEALDALEDNLERLARKNAGTLCAGRTHGMHAELTSFGYKMSGFYQELLRHRERIDVALEDCAVGSISGAVGTFSFLPRKLEEEVCKSLKLAPEAVATQVIPRDRHAALFTSFALFGGFIERLSVELRHLQRTEVGEAIEGFKKGQKGSSAMPHKKNPISAENLTGVARLLRSYSQAAMENQALWHERDISHSSVERVIFPDAFILMDYASHRLAELLKNLKVDAQRMKENIDLSQGSLFSSHVLLALLDKGLTREEAYAMVQNISHSLKPGQNLKNRLKKDKDVKALLGPREIDAIFNERRLKAQFEKLVQQALRR